MSVYLIGFVWCKLFELMDFHWFLSPVSTCYGSMCVFDMFCVCCRSGLDYTSSFSQCRLFQLHFVSGP